MAYDTCTRACVWILRLSVVYSPLLPPPFRLSFPLERERKRNTKFEFQKRELAFVHQLLDFLLLLLAKIGRGYSM